jgi:hypothetical protein
MKTKNLTLTVLSVVGTITGSIAQNQTEAASGNWMNSFSTTEYLLMAVTCVMAAVIWVLGKTIKSLSEQLR